MAYFVWQQDKDLVGPYAHFDKEPANYEVTDWDSGRRSAKALPELTLVTNDEFVSRLTDLLLIRFDLQVFSPKLVAALEEAGVKNIDYYPAKIVDHETGAVTDTYRTANVIGRIACLDEQNSVCTYASGDNSLLDIEEFSIHEHKISPTPEMDGDPLMFRLDEVESIILVHASVREHLERAGITGVKFTEPEQYLGF